MLSTLRIENIAIIEQLELEFGSGLNILTGETGAGKSIILKAIGLLSGKRTQASIIRSGSTKAVVEGLFILPELTLTKIRHDFEEISDVFESDELIIRRVIDQSGRSKFYLNGALFPLGTVSQLSTYLMDITGQHDQQTLRSTSSHRDILDAFGVPQNALEDAANAFTEWKILFDKLDKIRNSRRELELRAERLVAEKEELESAQLKKGEKVEIQQELEKLQYADKIQTSLTSALSLFDRDNESGENSNPGLEEIVAKLGSLIDSSAKYDPSLSEIVSLLASAQAQLAEVKLQTEDYLYKQEHDAGHFEELQIRLSELNRLERKYRKTNDEILDYLGVVLSELSDFEGGSFDEKALEEKVKEREKELNKTQKILRVEREKVSTKLSASVNKGLKDIQLKKAEFSISITDTEPSSKGADLVQFLFTANPGEPPQAIDKVASGGELSRVLLILKSIASEAKSAPLQVFDEIDVGVSGAVAQIVGEKLLRISKDSQVLVITHAAQVAALADRHILVSKESKKDRTYSNAHILNEKERQQAIAEMLAGKTVSEQFQLSAKELLDSRSKGS